MIHLKATLLALAAVAFTIPTLANAESIVLVNPSFETGDFTGYTQSGNTGFTSVSGSFSGVDPVDGNYQASFGPVGSTGSISQSFTDNANEIYTLNYDLYNFGGTPSSFAASVDGVTLLGLTNPDAFPYTLESQTFVGTGNDSFTFTFQQDPSYLLLDNISIVGGATVTPEPSSFVLLGSGVLGLAGAARRRFLKA